MLTFSNFDIQCRVASLGFDPGPFDGILGIKSKTAINAARIKRGYRGQPGGPYTDLFHPSGMHRIVLHWTAGAHGVTADEGDHYHFIAGAQGDWHHFRNPEVNASTADGQYCAHTLGCNTGSIGVALDAMRQACESPFTCGDSPITEVQLARFVREVAYLAVAYDIPVHPVSILSHAEVQSTLGRPQKQKWDITWLPGMDRPGTARAVGDTLRAMIQKDVEAVRAS